MGRSHWGRNYQHSKPGVKEPKNPRDVATMMQKFLEWNMWGKGKAETNSRSSVYWHRDDVFYRGWKPVARCLHAEGEGTVLFRLYDEACGLYNMKDFLPVERMFSVEDICVFGVGHGMTMEHDTFLAMLRMQLVGKASYLVDQAHGLSYDRCFKWVRDIGKLAATTGKPMNDLNDWRINSSKQMIVACGDAYRRLNDLFDLGWPDFDDATLLAQYLDIVHARAAAYADNTPKRERAKARREAAKALGLDEVVEAAA